MMLQLGGMSITVTSLANAAAFGFGSLTTIPAIRWFCWQAVLCILADWVLQLTFFLACVALIERRHPAPPAAQPPPDSSSLRNLTHSSSNGHDLTGKVIACSADGISCQSTHCTTSCESQTVHEPHTTAVEFDSDDIMLPMAPTQSCSAPQMVHLHHNNADSEHHCRKSGQLLLEVCAHMHAY